MQISNVLFAEHVIQFCSLMKKNDKNWLSYLWRNIWMKQIYWLRITE